LKIVCHKTAFSDHLYMKGNLQKRNCIQNARTGRRDVRVWILKCRMSCCVHMRTIVNY